MCSLLLRLWLLCKHFWNLAAQMVRWWSTARLYIDYLTCCISLHITRLLKVHFILHCGSGSSFFSLPFYHNHCMDMFLFYKPLYNPMETFLQNITLTVSRFVHLAANTFHFEMGKLKLQSIVKLNYLRSNFCFITGTDNNNSGCFIFLFNLSWFSKSPKNQNIVRQMNLFPQRIPTLVKFTWGIPCAAASLSISPLCLWQCQWLFWSIHLDWTTFGCWRNCLFRHWLI